MRGLLVTLLTVAASVMASCGRESEAPSVPAQPAKELTDTALIRALDAYRAVCIDTINSPSCTKEVEIYYDDLDALGSDTLGFCSKGVQPVPTIAISNKTKTWDTLSLHLLVAHEAEHCLRDIEHNMEGGIHLMRPKFLSPDEASLKSYDEWLVDSFLTVSVEPER